MIEAALGFVLIGQRIEMSHAGPPPPLFSFEIADMSARSTRSFGVHHGRHDGPNPERIDRWFRQGGGDGAHDSVRVDQCPALRPLLEQAVRLPLPSPALARISVLEDSAPRDRVWYRLRGPFQDDEGRVGRLEVSAVERPGAEPSALARWTLAMEAAFEACLDQEATPTAADRPEGRR